MLAAISRVRDQLVKTYLNTSIFLGALCNHINGCTGFSWGSPDNAKKGLQNKCFLKSGSVTDNIDDRSGIVSGLVGCPVTECSMMDTDLLGGLPLVDFENIETWQDCGNFRIALFEIF